MLTLGKFHYSLPLYLSNYQILILYIIKNIFIVMNIDGFYPICLNNSIFWSLNYAFLSIPLIYIMRKICNFA